MLPSFLLLLVSLPSFNAWNGMTTGISWYRKNASTYDIRSDCLQSYGSSYPVDVTPARLLSPWPGVLLSMTHRFACADPANCVDDGLVYFPIIRQSYDYGATWTCLKGLGYGAAGRTQASYVTYHRNNCSFICVLGGNMPNFGGPTFRRRSLETIDDYGHVICSFNNGTTWIEQEPLPTTVRRGVAVQMRNEIWVLGGERGGNETWGATTTQFRTVISPTQCGITEWQRVPITLPTDYFYDMQVLGIPEMDGSTIIVLAEGRNTFEQSSNKHYLTKDFYDWIDRGPLVFADDKEDINYHSALLPAPKDEFNNTLFLWVVQDRANNLTSIVAYSADASKAANFPLSSTVYPLTSSAMLNPTKNYTIFKNEGLPYFFHPSLSMPTVVFRPNPSDPSNPLGGEPVIVGLSRVTDSPYHPGSTGYLPPEQYIWHGYFRACANGNIINAYRYRNFSCPPGYYLKGCVKDPDDDPCARCSSCSDYYEYESNACGRQTVGNEAIIFPAILDRMCTTCADPCPPNFFPTSSCSPTIPFVACAKPYGPSESVFPPPPLINPDPFRTTSTNTITVIIILSVFWLIILSLPILLRAPKVTLTMVESFHSDTYLKLNANGTNSTMIGANTTTNHESIEDSSPDNPSPALSSINLNPRNRIPGSVPSSSPLSLSSSPSKHTYVLASKTVFLLFLGASCRMWQMGMMHALLYASLPLLHILGIILSLVWCLCSVVGLFWIISLFHRRIVTSSSSSLSSKTSAVSYDESRIFLSKDYRLIYILHYFTILCSLCVYPILILLLLPSTVSIPSFHSLSDNSSVRNSFFREFCGCLSSSLFIMLTVIFGFFDIVVLFLQLITFTNTTIADMDKNSTGLLYVTLIVSLVSLVITVRANIQFYAAIKGVSNYLLREKLPHNTSSQDWNLRAHHAVHGTDTGTNTKSNYDRTTMETNEIRTTLNPLGIQTGGPNRSAVSTNAYIASSTPVSPFEFNISLSAPERNGTNLSSAVTDNHTLTVESRRALQVRRQMDEMMNLIHLTAATVAAVTVNDDSSSSGFTNANHHEDVSEHSGASDDVDHPPVLLSSSLGTNNPDGTLS